MAAGVVPLATGGDGGGSIRIPEAFSGVFGLKTSYGVVPNFPGRWARSRSMAACRATAASSRPAPVARVRALAQVAVPATRFINRLKGGNRLMYDVTSTADDWVGVMIPTCCLLLRLMFYVVEWFTCSRTS